MLKPDSVEFKRQPAGLEMKPVQRCQKLQSLEWPLEAGPKSESIYLFIADIPQTWHTKKDIMTPQSSSYYTDKKKRKKEGWVVTLLNDLTHVSCIWHKFLFQTQHRLNIQSFSAARTEKWMNVFPQVCVLIRTDQSCSKTPVTTADSVDAGK